MSEFLIRGWNVAIPEVDIGDDIFVVQDDEGALRRVQVKTSTATTRQNGFSAQFKLPLSQLFKFKPASPTYYFFLLRFDDGWSKPIVIKQKTLFDYVQSGKLGQPQNETLMLYLAFANDKVQCAGMDFTQHLMDFTDFPILGL